MASLVEKKPQEFWAGSLFSPFPRWDAVQPLPQRYTLKPVQDTFDHLFSLWLPSATRIVLNMIQLYVSQSTAWLNSISLPGKDSPPLFYNNGSSGQHS